MNWLNECHMAACSSPPTRWFRLMLSSGDEILLALCAEHFDPDELTYKHREIPRDEAEVWEVMRT